MGSLRTYSSVLIQSGDSSQVCDTYTTSPVAKMRIILACDGYGASIKDAVKQHLVDTYPVTVQVDDRGVFGKYYDAAHLVGGEVQRASEAGAGDRAVLCCGTGAGMAVVANRYPTVVAVPCASEQAARDARSINDCNVLALGGMTTAAEEATRIVDVWLATAFKEGWAPAIQDFLAQSKPEIAALRFPGAAAEEGKASVPSVPFPSAPIFVDSSEAGGGFEPIPGLGSDRCMWCRLREDGAAAGQHGTRLRALVRFPKGCVEPPHHHTHGHDVLVLHGHLVLSDLTAGQTQELTAQQYAYTPGGRVHTVVYHEETLLFLGCDGEFDLLWDSEQQGAQFPGEATAS